MVTARSPLVGDGEGLFTVFVVRNDRTTVVWVVGEVDLDSEEQLACVGFALRGDADVIVDLSRVTFGDMTLVRFLADLRLGHRVTLRDAPRLCRELLTVSQRPGPDTDELTAFMPPIIDIRKSEVRGTIPAGAGTGTPS
jgi:hypothetical protein